MDKEFYDKYGKELDCKSCIGLQECSTNSNIPLCDKGYRRFAKDKIADLETELAEKDKEIDRLKNLFELNNEVVINQGKEIFDLRVQVLQQKQNQTQLTIQELEKVKVSLKDKILMMKNEEHSYLQKVVTWYDICDQINNQIKELKGE